ncbi:MAG: hypothetical protein FK730_03160 [Asgard group archaeon]|nr:hypothetical protein [Asgard group archaeon]
MLLLLINCLIIKPKNMDVIGDKTSTIENIPFELILSENRLYDILNMPYENMAYDTQFGDAAACLSMLSEYYDKKVSKEEINIIVDPTYSPWLGISLEGLIRAATYDKYSTRDFGYYCEIISMQNMSYEERWNTIKDYIDQGIPLILIAQQVPNYPTHHRLVIGYDERLDVIYMNDPWQYGGNPIYQGPKEAMSIKNGSWLETTWTYADNNVAVVRPIGLNLELDKQPITTASNVNLTCTIDNSFMNESKDLCLELSLPTGYSLLSGALETDFTNIKGIIKYTWKIACPTPSIDDKFVVKITTKNDELKIGGQKAIFPSQPEKIVNKIYSNYQDDIAPCRVNIVAEMNYSEILSSSLHCFSMKPDASIIPENNSYSEEILEISPDMLECNIGPNRPDWIVFCWFKFTTIYGSTLSPTIVISTIDSDSDQDGLSDYDEEVIYLTDPNKNDTDQDGMNDFDEIAQGFDPLNPASNLKRKRIIIGLSISIPSVIVISSVILVYFGIKKRSQHI